MATTTTAKKNRRLASGSLAVMAAGFAATIPFPGGAAGPLHAGFEAGVIGGLADWFAVTALFRHPLGIPIPHTALLPRNRKKMSEGIVRVVQDRLLAKESIIEKLSQVELAAQLLPAVRNALKSAVYSERLPYYLEQAIRGIDTDKVVPLLSGEIRAQSSALICLRCCVSLLIKQPRMEQTSGSSICFWSERRPGRGLKDFGGSWAHLP